MQVHDVRLESGQHLLDRLGADSAAQIVVLREKLRPHTRPVVRDGIAHQDDQRSFLDFLVGIGIAVEPRPIHHPLRRSLPGPLLRPLPESKHRQGGKHQHQDCFFHYFKWLFRKGHSFNKISNKININK